MADETGYLCGGENRDDLKKWVMSSESGSEVTPVATFQRSVMRKENLTTYSASGGRSSRNQPWNVSLSLQFGDDCGGYSEDYFSISVVSVCDDSLM